AFTRRGKAGETSELAKLILATFQHGTSRALDPQLHTHALVLNACVRSDGSTGSIVSKPIYLNKMLAGALYRVEFAHRLTKELGLVCRRENTWFEIEGVPANLMAELSKRRAEIKAELFDRKLESASAAALAALATRKLKDVVPPRSELFRRWKEVGDSFG